MCTALQAVASPLGHSTAGIDATHPRADDGIRTRDPHLGKVMRYQLRYIRVLRASSSSVAMHDISPRSSAYTNPLLARRAAVHNSWSKQLACLAGEEEAVPVGVRQPYAGGFAGAAAGIQPHPVRRIRPKTGRAQRIPGTEPPRVSLLPRSALSNTRSRSSVGERPPHTRKVAGSNPAGTTTHHRGSPAMWATTGKFISAVKSRYSRNLCRFVWRDTSTYLPAAAGSGRHTGRAPSRRRR